MRTRSLSIAVLLLAGTGLAACSAPGSIDGCTPTMQPGEASRQVQVQEQQDAAPTVDFQAPLVSEGSQASLTGGSGAPATAGTVVVADYVAYAGKNGALLSSSHPGEEVQQAEPLRLVAGETNVLSEAVTCASVGSQVVLTTSIADLFGPNAASAELDITPADTAVVVLDVRETYPGRASGAPQPGVQGMPAIALAPDGRPGVTFPGSPAPEALTVMQSIRGTGEPVQDGDRALIHYTGVVWETEEVFDSSWERGAPAEFTISDDSLVPGFVDAVVGQPVGSQVVVSIPQELGYNDPASRPAAISEGDHMLFVIDILAVLPPQE